jgi:hypothetical protein
MATLLQDPLDNCTLALDDISLAIRPYAKPSGTLESASDMANWNDNRQPSTTLPPPHILPLLLHQLPFPLPGPQLKPLRKILRLYIKPRRIVILSGYPPIFPPNIAAPRNPCGTNIQTWLRDILPRGDLSSEAERAEVLQIRIPLSGSR